MTCESKESRAELSNIYSERLKIFSKFQKKVPKEGCTPIGKSGNIASAVTEFSNRGNDKRCNVAVAYPNLSAEMKRMGITQGDLADAIGVTQVTVSRWFNGHRRPSVETCFKVKERLFPNLTVDYLFSSEPDWLKK